VEVEHKDWKQELQKFLLAHHHILPQNNAHVKAYHQDETTFRSTSRKDSTRPLLAAPLVTIITDETEDGIVNNDNNNANDGEYDIANEYDSESEYFTHISDSSTIPYIGEETRPK